MNGAANPALTRTFQSRDGYQPGIAFADNKQVQMPCSFLSGNAAFMTTRVLLCGATFFGYALGEGAKKLYRLRELLFRMITVAKKRNMR